MPFPSSICSDGKVPCLQSPAASNGDIKGIQLIFFSLSLSSTFSSSSHMNRLFLLHLNADFWILLCFLLSHKRSPFYVFFELLSIVTDFFQMDTDFGLIKGNAIFHT